MRAIAPVRLQRILVPARDAKRQPRYWIDLHEIARGAKYNAGPKDFVLRQVAELNHRLIVQVKCNLPKFHAWNEHGRFVSGAGANDGRGGT